MEKLRHFELGDRGLGGTFLHVLKGRRGPKWLTKPESHSTRESACKGRPFYTPLLSAWHQEKLGRDQNVNKQQVPGCPCTLFETHDI